MSQSFKFDHGQVKGAFLNNLWIVDTGNDLSGDAARIVSLHEYFHWYLNNSSMYGMVMVLLHALAEQSGTEGCGMELEKMMNESVEIHEIYATWFSTTATQQSRNDVRAAEVLNNEYLSYFNSAEQLVPGIKSRMLCRLVVTAYYTWCMQGASIAREALKGIQHFNLQSIDENDFPGNRLKLLRKNITPQKLEAFLSGYIYSLPPGDVREKLIKQINGESDPADGEDSDLKWITPLIQALFSSFDIFCGLDNVNTIETDKHIPFARLLYEQMYELYPGTRGQYRLNPSPTDLSRNIVMQFEGEKLFFRDTPSIARLEFAANMSDKALGKLFLLDTNKILLIAAGPWSLKDQFRFVVPADLQWLDAQHKFLVYLHYRDENNTVRMLVFENTSDWKYFLSLAPGDWGISGVAHFSILGEPDWEERSTIFENDCRKNYYLNDVSILYFLEREPPADTTVHYTSFILEVGRRELSSLVFQFKWSDIAYETILSPCSVAHEALVDSYITEQNLAITYARIEEPANTEIFNVLRVIYETYLAWMFYQNLAIDTLIKR